MSTIQQKNIYCRKLNTAYLEGIPVGAPKGIVFFIHGCPDDANLWRKLMEKFLAEGLIVLAPFLRGIDRSEGPVEKKSQRYSPHSVTLDHLEVLSWYNQNLPVTVVCHDVGSVSGWELARRLGSRLKRLVAINSPDSLTLLRQFRKTSQIKKSWYIGFIQTGKIADVVFSQFKKPLIKKTMLAGGYPDIDSDIIDKAAERLPNFLPHYREAFGDLPNRLFNIFNKKELIHSPLILWGIKDPFLNVPTAKDLNTVAINPEIRVLEGGHWLPLEREDDVFRLIMKKSSHEK